MRNTLNNNWFFYLTIAYLCFVCIACTPKEEHSSARSLVDTISVATPTALIAAIKSNRYIKLTSNHYLLSAPLQIDGIQNLSIEGSAGTQIVVYGDALTVININKSSNIHLDSLELGFKDSIAVQAKSIGGVLNITDANSINISNIKLYGRGGLGLKTHNVDGFFVSNVGISHSDFMIFELQNTSNAKFSDCVFYDNQYMKVCVLGAFTHGTKEVVFSNTNFLNNSPEQPGNPAFNFMENLNNKVLFKACEFRNNKGFKWYNDNIILENCKIDTTDFVNAMDL